MRRGTTLLFIAIVVAVAARLLLILLVSPGSDVFYSDQQGVKVLLGLQNPYGHHFTGIPTSLNTRGAESTFAYPPFAALYLVPFYFMSDIRIGFVLADALVGVMLYLLSDMKLPTSLLYLFIPFTLLFSTVYLNNGLISIFFIALFAVLEYKGRRLLGALAFGVSLAAIQFAWLLLPFALFYYLRAARWKESIISLFVGLGIMLPFFLAAPTVFYNNVIAFQFSRETSSLITIGGPFGFSFNPSMNEFFITFLKFGLPQGARLSVSAALLPVFVYGARTLPKLLLRSTMYMTLAIFILPNNFFWSYAELPFFLFLAYASLVWPKNRHFSSSVSSRA